jgi:hypothetical protein
MSRDKLTDRGRANEERYFRREEAAKLEQLRRDIDLEEERRHLHKATGITSELLVRRIQELGLTDETVVLLDVLPSVEVAWAERVLTPRERDAVVVIAAELGVAAGSPAHRLLGAYLTTPPEEAFFAEARDVLTAVIDTMPEMEARMRRGDVVDHCREVAHASGGVLARIGLGDTISTEEREAIGRVSARLERRRPGAAGMTGPIR